MSNTHRISPTGESYGFMTLNDGGDQSSSQGDFFSQFGKATTPSGGEGILCTYNLHTAKFFPTKNRWWFSLLRNAGIYHPGYKHGIWYIYYITTVSTVKDKSMKPDVKTMRDNKFCRKLNVMVI